jgi:hypothetical protein
MATSTLGNGTLVLAGTTSGTTTVTATAVAGTTTLTLPAATDTLVGKATTDTLTNKTLTGAAMNGTLGATTPSTGAFTTVTASGLADARFFRATANATANSANSVMMDFDAGNNFGRIISQGANSSTGANFQIRLTASDGIGAVTTPALFSSSGVSITNTVGVGGATPSTSGAGITFPATQSASTDANTLDDYEEGTWTPSVGGNATYSLQAGGYTKIGRMVYVTGAMAITSLGTGSTGTLSGLPFTSVIAGGANCVVQIGYFANLAVNVIAPWGFLNNSANSFTIYSLTTAGTSLGSALAVFGNSARIDFQLSYPVAT